MINKKGAKMALYILSDTHLSKAKEKPMDIFGSRWTSHAEKIEKNWQAVVTPSDTVIIGGDISWGISLDEAAPDLKFIADLPGKKIFLRGNHDYWWNTLTKNREFFDRCGICGIDFLQNNAISAEGFVICGTRGWYSDSANAPSDTDYKKIVAREALRLKMSLDASHDMEGERIAIFHFPPVFGDYVCREIVDILHEYNIDRVFFGHIHGLYRVPQVTLFEDIEFSLCSCDFLNFIPYRIDHVGTHKGEEYIKKL